MHFDDPDYLQYDDYGRWETAAMARGWSFLTVTNGKIAQDRAGTCQGFWQSFKKKGWMTPRPSLEITVEEANGSSFAKII
jgi:hypothetical protein